MAVQYQEDDATQHSLRVGDTVLLYAKEYGYVFSHLSSDQHNSVALFKTDFVRDPNLPNVHFATFKVVMANKFKAQDCFDKFNKQISGKILAPKERNLKYQLEMEVARETVENNAEQDRLQGSNLVYGDRIQLLHTASKKYLAVNTTKTSRIENTNLRVELTAKNSESCIFKILPRYKVRSVGDEVRFSDQVKFESLKTTGQFLHCSSRPYRGVFPVLEECYELNLSATESALTVVSHYRPMPSHDPKALRGGGVVRLFHREKECYISAEGSFAESEVVVEDVHCRKRHSELGRLKDPSTSANVYWQFEKESDSRSGEPLFWGERCRIKHLPTRRYLAVVYDSPKDSSKDSSKGTYYVKLKERSVSSSFSGSNSDLETVFSLSPVIQENDTIQVESYARIKHLQTRTWLHLDKSQPFDRISFKPNAPGLQGLEWDSAELFPLTATETKNYDDAFTLELVTEKLLDNFNYVAGIVPILTSHIRIYQGGPPPYLDSRNAYLLKGALQNLSDFMDTASETENKNRQKLLRNLRVLERVIEVLGLFRVKKDEVDDKDDKDRNEQQLVCQACYGVIKSYLNGDSRKNENYLARFVWFFKTQVGLGLNAEEVMIEMVEDNSAIVQKMAETEMDYMIKQLVESETKDNRFMDFLGNLCVCEERAIPSTQNTILDKLVYKHAQNVFYLTAVGGSSQHPTGADGEVYVKVPGSREWEVLSQVVLQKDKLEYLESQLNLFARMCWGKNTRTIYALDKDDQALITFEEVLLCARNRDLKPSLRSKYVLLMKVMYVDVGENRNVLENLSLSFIYEKVVEDPYAETGGEDTIALTGVENKNFPYMKVWIKEHIEMAAESKMIASEVEENELLADVIEVLNLLVKYGYYDDKEDVEDVLKPLLNVLNGFTDLPFPISAPQDAQQEQVKQFTKTKRFTETMENKALFDVKARVMEVVDLFFNFRLYVRLQRFMYDFRVLKGDHDDSSHSALERLASRSTFELALAQIEHSRPPAELSSLQSADPENVRKNHNVVELARKRLEFIFSQSEYSFEAASFYFEGSGDEKLKFPDILIDVSRYVDHRLFQGSLHLLNRYYSSEMTLFEKAIQTQLLIAPKSCEVFEEVDKLLPDLRHYMSVDLGESGRVKIITILRTFTKMCHLKEEDEPHPQNQKILYNYGLFSDVLGYVLRISKVSALTSLPDDSEDSEVKSKQGSALRRKKAVLSTSDDAADKNNVAAVCVECFKFLKAVAKDFVEVQTRLYAFMEGLLEVEIGIASMADVLTEVFTGGPDLCLKVKEDQVARLFSLIARDDLPEGRPELLHALQAMAKVEQLDLPVKRNQSFIVTHFSKTREKFCDHLLGEEKRGERETLLTEGDDEDERLTLLIALTDLLASCAEGENLFIESVCQTVFSVDELLAIISNQFIVAERKRPFARFLVSVYLAAASDKFSSGASSLTSQEEMWVYLDHIATFLSNMGKVLRTMPSSEKSLVRQGLSSATRRYTASQRARKRTRTPRTQSKAIPFITGDNGQLLPGVLLYFSDGLLPLLTAYYKDFFRPPRDGEKRERQFNVSARIATALLEMADVLAEHLTEDAQVKLYRGTVLTILKEGGDKLPLTVDEQVYAVFELKTKDCKGFETVTRQLYNDTYAAEVELNKTFNDFVTNFQVAYQGPNTAVAQVGSKYESIDYSEGDECLPLGPSFQQHIACFTNRQASTQREVVLPCVERLLAQLQFSFSNLQELDDDEERQRQDELDIKCLQIMRAIIHNEIVTIDPNLEEDSPTGYRKRCVNRVQPIQNSIQDLGNAVSRVVPMLSHANDEIVREVLAFLKAMLFSGNRHVQEGLNTVFDTREERLFITMVSLLQNSAITFNERRSLLRQVEARSVNDALLKERPQDLVKSDASLRRAKPPVQISIDIEVSTTGSPIAGQSVTSVVPFEETYLDDNEDELDKEYVKKSQGPLLTVSPKEQRRASHKPAVAQLLEMETLRSNAGASTEGAGNGVTDELVKFKDDYHIKLALQVLGLMCDGQYRLMQNYLREQKDNLSNVNVVGEVALFIQNFSLTVDSETMDLLHLILQTLIEMCVGNYPNQLVIYNRQIIESLNHIFTLDVYDEETNSPRGDVKNTVNLKGSAVELLEAMLEKTDEKTPELVAQIFNGLQIDVLHNNLSEFHQLMNNQTVKNEGFDDEAEDGLFRTYHILVHLTDYGIPMSKIEPKECNDDSEAGNIYRAWSYCKKKSRSVEVFYKNMNGEKVLTRIHFPFDPAHALREEVVEKVKWNISRDSPEDKLRGLLEWMKAVKRDTLHSAKLQKFIPTRILTAFPRTRYYLLVFWSMLMSLFTLMAFMIPEGDISDEQRTALVFTFTNSSGAIQPAFLDYWGSAYRPVLYTFGSVHLILSIWMVLEYFINNWPNFRLPSIFYIIITQCTKRTAPEETNSDISVFGLQTIYVVVFLLCSILSLIFDGYFYCICLLHIIVNNDILQRVLKSVTKNGKSLLWVAALGVVVLFIYAVVSFAFLHESFEQPDNDDATLFCSTLYECFASTIRYGLIDNLGLVVPIIPEVFSVSAVRLLYDVSFFIIVTTIGLNIVFGIIVDTFSELRDERFRTEQDKKSVCFICSIASHEFERRADGFDNHVKRDHNMWGYIYLSIFLDTIDVSNHNAIQKFVFDNIRDEKIEFFPLLHALSLGKEEDETGKQLEELKAMVERVLKRFEEEEHQKSLRSKRQEQKKWEEQNLRQDPSFDARMSLDSVSLVRSGIQPRAASFDYRQRSFDFSGQPPEPSLPELPSDEP